MLRVLWLADIAAAPLHMLRADARFSAPWPLQRRNRALRGQRLEILSPLVFPSKSAPLTVARGHRGTLRRPRPKAYRRGYVGATRKQLVHRQWAHPVGLLAAAPLFPF